VPVSFIRHRGFGMEQFDTDAQENASKKYKLAWSNHLENNKQSRGLFYACILLSLVSISLIYSDYCTIEYKWILSIITTIANLVYFGFMLSLELPSLRKLHSAKDHLVNTIKAASNSLPK
jgi:hypothetical protein